MEMFHTSKLASSRMVQLAMQQQVAQYARELVHSHRPGLRKALHGEVMHAAQQKIWPAQHGMGEPRTMNDACCSQMVCSSLDLMFGKDRMNAVQLCHKKD